MTSDLVLALEMADLADSISGSHFGRPMEVSTKADGTPVTVVDRHVEEALCGLAARRRPADGFLGEEVGRIHRDGTRRWIVDGIDGTHNFAAGHPEWGTLIALEVEGDVVVGVAPAPALRQRWWAARGEGAWTSASGDVGGSEPQRLSVSSTPTLSEAVAIVLPPAEVAEYRSGWRGRVADRVEATARRAAPTVNGYAPLLVAEGRIDASVHLWGGEWDHAALIPIVEEAGGRFSDLWGGRRLDTETAVFSNAPLAGALVELIRDHVGPEPPRPSAPAVRAVIFDLGGVLIDTGDPMRRRSWELRLGLPVGRLDELLTEAIGPGWAGGRTEADIWAWLQGRLGLGESEMAELRVDLYAHESLEPTLARFMDRVRGSWRLGIITNNGPEVRRYLNDRYSLEALVDTVVISGEEKIAKPDPRIYRIAAERLAVDPEECVFVDDREDCVEGARAVGMIGLHHTEPAKTLAELQRIIDSSSALRDR